jgi:hypothetical protein
MISHKALQRIQRTPSDYFSLPHLPGPTEAVRFFTNSTLLNAYQLGQSTPCSATVATRCMASFCSGRISELAGCRPPRRTAGLSGAGVAEAAAESASIIISSSRLAMTAPAAADPRLRPAALKGAGDADGSDSMARTPLSEEAEAELCNAEGTAGPPPAAAAVSSASVRGGALRLLI